MITVIFAYRIRPHVKNVSWLRRTQYISTEITRYNPQNFENVEAKVGVNIKKSFKVSN